MAKAKKKRGPGRPPGAANKNGVSRDEFCTQFRCSTGFNKTVEAMKQFGYKSKADVLHDALQLLAFKKELTVPKEIYWRGKIQ